MKCPYCGSEHISEAVSLCEDNDELAALGIEIPKIQQCRSCKATLSPVEFTINSEAYQAAYDRSH